MTAAVELASQFVCDCIGEFVFSFTVIAFRWPEKNDGLIFERGEHSTDTLHSLKSEQVTTVVRPLHAYSTL